MVTRRKEAELARLAAAEESSRLKDEFLATLSHELRTPLNAIVGWVYVLQTAGVTPPMTKQAIEVIARNARLQSQLIEDILDVSRIITGKLEIEHVPVSVHQFLETAIAGIAPAAAAKAIGLDLQIPAALPPIEGDPKRLHQVLNNVLANAIKFTPHGGTIVLSCQSDGASVILQVRDSGIGIEPEFLPYIFDRFRQGDSRPTRAHGGLGLGLAIARHLVDQHDGEITASSDGTGKGTTISIVLPASSIGLSPGVAESALVVDDQADSREMLAMLLEQHGATVVQRDSAESALAFLGDAPVDVMIADIAMPGIDGYELLQRLRARGNRTPAIALTAFARADDQRRALECGYDHYLAKPVDAASLVRTVRCVMAPLVSPGP
jgi:CheY-like chemotaxis protein